ncbi:MAG: transglutaminase [Flavobacteriaceae bacterium]|nr:transglutaminase [Flavobacteriaceae bacterium]|tara:strand:+ start:33103 stop:33738 length:636 start_codon:yes stop_codon:yes gene_type:complete
MDYSKSTFFFDTQSKEIQDIIADYQSNSLSKKEITIGLYNFVRDHWRYNPFKISFVKENYKASEIAKRDQGNCIEKSIILITCLRALGIPARLHLGKVKNHIAVESLTKKLGTNELTPHGMVNVFLDGKWLKMSPAFNKELCERFQVEPLEFDGENNSFLQQYNSHGDEFMEYIEDYGFFEDVPIDFMIQNLKDNYPKIFKNDDKVKEYDF